MKEVRECDEEEEKEDVFLLKVRKQRIKSEEVCSSECAARYRRKSEGSAKFGAREMVRARVSRSVRARAYLGWLCARARRSMRPEE